MGPGDAIEIQIRLQGARAAAADAQIVEASIKDVGDASTRAGIASQTASKKHWRQSRGFQALARAAKMAFYAIGTVGVFAAYKSVRAAVDLGEQINKTRVVFEGSAKGLLKWSRTTALAFGISRRQALESAGVFGNMLVPMGFIEKDAAKMSRRLVELGADMASFNNASPEETLDAIRAGLAGETEPLRRFGVFLSADRVALEASKKGLSDNYAELTAAQKAQIGYNIILKDTIKAKGDFGRTSDSLANQERILKAQLEDLGAELGKALIPALTSAAKWFSNFIQEFQKGEGTGGDVRKVFSDIGGVIKDLSPLFKNVLLPLAGGVIKGLFGTLKAFAGILGFVGKVAAPLKPIFVLLGTVLAFAFGGGVVKAITWVSKFSRVLKWILFPIKLVFRGLAWLGGKLSFFQKLVAGVVAQVGSSWGDFKASAASAFRAVVSGAGKLVGFIKTLPGKFMSAGKGAFNWIKTAFKSAINWVITGWNNLEFKIPGFDPPGPGPKFGGITIGTPDIPTLGWGAQIMAAGRVIVGDRGREVLSVPAGASVKPLTPESGIPDGGGASSRETVVHAHLHVDGKEVARTTVRAADDEAARK